MKLFVVFTTVGTPEDARRLSNGAVNNGLAACVQIEAIESVYTWKNQIENDKELRLLFKTTHERYSDFERFILANHPYELPALYAVEITNATDSYAQWVVANTR